MTGALAAGIAGLSPLPVRRRTFLAEEASFHGRMIAGSAAEVAKLRVAWQEDIAVGKAGLVALGRMMMLDTL
jgi:hypothetical protein